MNPQAMPNDPTLVFVGMRTGNSEPQVRFVAVTVRGGGTGERIQEEAERVMARKYGRGWRWAQVDSVICESTTGNAYHNSTPAVGGVAGFVLALEKGLETVAREDGKRVS